MTIFRASAVAILIGCTSASAFNFNSPHIDVPRTRIGISAAPTPTLIDLPCLDSISRRRTRLHMIQSFNEPEESSQSQTSCGDHEQVDTSRRAALRQCSSIFAATAFASIWNRQEAHASEFSEFPNGEIVQQENPIQNTAPQFYDENVITPPRPQVVQQEEAPESNPIPSKSSVSATVASNPLPPPPAEVTLENSQVVTIPTKQVPVSHPAQSNQAIPAVTPSTTPAKPNSDKYKEEVPTKDQGKYVAAEVGTTTVFLGATAYALSGQVKPNSDKLTAKCKIVMIENEPYGLDTGRRWYNGVDVTINQPIPASDVREQCDAGTVNDDCTETITGFLGEVSTNKVGGGGEGPSMEQQETATAVLSYLNTLNGVSVPAAAAAGDATSETAVAFASYLNELSNGEIDAPASPQLVADYLDSISGDGIQRLSTIENRVNALESSVNRLPDEISGRLVQWQEQQDERLSNEFRKITSFLVNNNNNMGDSSPVNGSHGSSPVNGEGHQSRLPFR
mmetsp:Transcript_15881/g.28814  ORF Transcript_15881/g.28814 Transcript_15881/m.28814 type:complete len:508 (-) Transcript_15881:432-1955(-)